MKSFYKLIQVITDHLKASLSVNSVSIGNLSEIDLKKQTIYPLAHIIVDRVSYGPATAIYDIRILVVDTVYESQNDIESETEPLKGTNNLQDVFNSTLAVINTVQTHLRIGNMEDSYFKLASDPTAEPFQERFEDLVAGWVLNLAIETPNADINVCDY